MDQSTKKIDTIDKLLHSVSDESLALYISKHKGAIDLNLDEMIKNNNFSSFNLFLTHNEAKEVTSNLSKKTGEFDLYQKTIVDNIRDMLSDSNSDDIIIFHLIGLLKYFKDYKVDYISSVLQEVINGDNIAEIVKLSAINSLLLLGGSKDYDYILTEINKYKTNLALENFIYNYLVFYYNGPERAIDRMITYLGRRNPVLHMLFVIGDMIDYNTIEKERIITLENLLINEPKIDTDNKNTILHTFHMKMKK